jgi:hypothetical protein
MLRCDPIADDRRTIAERLVRSIQRDRTPARFRRRPAWCMSGTKCESSEGVTAEASEGRARCPQRAVAGLNRVPARWDSAPYLLGPARPGRAIRGQSVLLASEPRVRGFCACESGRMDANRKDPRPDSRDSRDLYILEMAPVFESASQALRLGCSMVLTRGFGCSVISFRNGWKAA